MEDFNEPFREFARAGGRAALAEHLLRLDEAARMAIRDGEEPEAGVMALREALNRVLSALDDLAGTAQVDQDAAAPPPNANRTAAGETGGERTT